MALSEQPGSQSCTMLCHSAALEEQAVKWIEDSPVVTVFILETFPDL